jgi:hypothetical protein
MPPRAEVVAHRAESLPESLRLLRGLEPLHRSLSLAYWPMRILGSVIEPLVPPMLSVRQRALDGRHVTGKLVGDHDSQLRAVLGLEYSTQETLGGVLVASTLDQDVQHRPILIDGAPQPYRRLFMVSATHPGTTCRRVARGAYEARLPAAGRTCAPKTDGLVADLDARSESSSSTSRWLSAKRWYRQTAWLMISGGKR